MASFKRDRIQFIFFAFVNIALSCAKYAFTPTGGELC